MTNRFTRGLRIRTKFRTLDQLVAWFHRFCDETSVFIPTSTPRPENTDTAFSIDLASGESMLVGVGVVLQSWTTRDNQFNAPGMHVRVRSLTRASVGIFEQMLAARAVAHTATVPARLGWEDGTEVRPPSFDDILPSAAPERACEIEIAPIPRQTQIGMRSVVAPPELEPAAAVAPGAKLSPMAFTFPAASKREPQRSAPATPAIENAAFVDTIVERHPASLPLPPVSERAREAKPVRGPRAATVLGLPAGRSPGTNPIDTNSFVETSVRSFDDKSIAETAVRPGDDTSIADTVARAERAVSVHDVVTAVRNADAVAAALDCDTPINEQSIAQTLAQDAQIAQRESAILAAQQARRSASLVARRSSSIVAQSNEDSAPALAAMMGAVPTLLAPELDTSPAARVYPHAMPQPIGEPPDRSTPLAWSMSNEPSRPQRTRRAHALIAIAASLLSGTITFALMTYKPWAQDAETAPAATAQPIVVPAPPPTCVAPPAPIAEPLRAIAAPAQPANPSSTASPQAAAAAPDPNSAAAPQAAAAPNPNSASTPVARPAVTRAAKPSATIAPKRVVRPSVKPKPPREPEPPCTDLSCL